MFAVGTGLENFVPIDFPCAAPGQGAGGRKEAAGGDEGGVDKGQLANF